MTSASARSKCREKKLSEFECGFICAMTNLAYSHGVGTEVRELYHAIGEPTSKQAKDSGLGEFDIAMIDKIRKECA